MKLAAGKLKLNWDALGTGASLVCAIHCAALPLLLSFVPLLNMRFLENPFIEYGLLLSSFFIGYIALYRGYKYHHGNKLPVFLFALGFPVLVWSHIRLTGTFAQVLIGLSAVLIIAAHLFNWSAHKNCAQLGALPSPSDNHLH